MDAEIAGNSDQPLLHEVPLTFSSILVRDVLAVWLYYRQKGLPIYRAWPGRIFVASGLRYPGMTKSGWASFLHASKRLSCKSVLP